MTFPQAPLAAVLAVAAVREQTIRGAVVPHQCDHIPGGSAWDCLGCGYRWPCRAYKRMVWNANHGDRERVAVVMAGWMEQARHAIRLSAAEYHSRFVEWIYRWPGR